MKSLRHSCRTFVAALVLLFPSLARAQPIEPPPLTPARATEPRFGSAGQLVLTGAIATSIISGHFSGTSEAGQTSIDVDPGFDYFVIDRVSVGLSLGIRYSDTKLYYGNALGETTSLGVDGGVRLGIDLPLSRYVSLYPRLKLIYGTIDQSFKPVPGANSGTLVSSKSSDDHFAVHLYAPLLFHPAPHFFVGFGPELYSELSHGSDHPGADNIKWTSIGASFILGGWI